VVFPALASRCDHLARRASLAGCTPSMRAVSSANTGRN